MALDAQGNYVPETQQILNPVTVPTPTASDVYSSSTITQANTAPIPKPNLNDPMGMYDYYMNSGDIKSAQSEYMNIQRELQGAVNTGRLRQKAIEQNPLESMGYIVGAQARAGQNDSLTQQSIAERLAIAQSNLMAKKETAKNMFDIANSQRSELTSLIVNNPGAGITYYDTPETASRKMETFRLSEEKRIKKEAEKAAKEAEKKSNKKELQTMYFQLTGKAASKKLSTKELKKLVSKAGSKQKAMEDEMNRLELQAKRVSIANASSKASGKSATSQVDRSDKGIQSLIDEAVNSGESWTDIASTLSGFGLNISSGSVADKHLRYKFLGEE